MGGVIKVTSTGIRICPYAKRQSKVLEKMTTYCEKATHKFVEVSGFFIKEDETFATYKLGSDFMSSLFPGYSFVNEAIYPFDKVSVPFEFNDDFELSDIQVPIMQKMMAVKQTEMFVNLPTSVGKTIVGIYYMKVYQVKTLICCYKSKILMQWYDTLVTKTDMDKSKIKVIGQSKYLEMIRTGEIDVSDIDVFLTTPSLITSYGNQYGWDNLSQALRKLKIGIKIIDEAHHNLGATVKMNAYTSIAKTMYLSADFNRASSYTKQQFFNVFRNVPILTLDDETLNKLRHISVHIYEYNSHPGVEDVLKITNTGMYKWSQWAYCKYQFYTNALIPRICSIMDVILSTQEISDVGFNKVLIMVDMIEHVDVLYNAIQQTYGSIRKVGKYHSKMAEGEEKDNVKSADIIISTYKSFSTGLNIKIPNIQHVISTSPIDVVLHNQSAGRCRPIDGKDSYYWILSDCGFEFCRNNIKKAKDYLSKSRVKKIASFIEGDK